MKKTFLLIAFAALAGFTMAQGNLQFNQVIHVKNTGSAYAPGAATVTSITVPTGKVWKIESASATDGDELSIDGQLVYGLPYMQGTNSYLSMHINMPVWLGPGTYSVTLYNDQAINAQAAYTTVISGIEFNVVP
jgi:hypothetical protein